MTRPTRQSKRKASRRGEVKPRGVKTAIGDRSLGGGCYPRKKWCAMKRRDGRKYFGYGSTERAAIKNLLLNLTPSKP